MPNCRRTTSQRPTPAEGAFGIDILLVEDSPEAVTVFERALRRDSARQYSVVRAGSLAEAARLLETRQPDLAFVDFWLPDGVGIELVELARARRWTETTSFVLLTEGDDETWSDQALEAGVQDYVLKSRLTTTALWQTIGFVQERKRVQQALKAQRDELDRQNRELQAVNARLAELASTDGLTGLKNHRAFQERLRGEVATAARHGLPLTVVLLDVDHFKGLNDAFGHPAGDEVLQRLAEVLQANVRAGDLVARYGGEEFALVLPSTDLAGGAAAAEKVREAIAAATFPYGAVTASLGCAELSNEDASSLLARADEALYAAKAAGRNSVRALEKSGGRTLPAVVRRP